MRFFLDFNAVRREVELFLILCSLKQGKKAYRMNLSRLGNAIILNNVTGSMPESRKDVAALQDMLDTVGFDVHTYDDCDEKVKIIFNQFYKKFEQIFFERFTC